GVELRTGEQLSCDELVLAVPHGRVLDLLPDDVAALPELQRISRIESAPITSLHLWFDRPLTVLPHAVLLGRLAQWVFRHPPPLSPTASTPQSSIPNPYQVVISASSALRGRSREAIRDEVLTELRSVWPASQAAQLLRWKLVTERTAVFSVTPGIESLRPQQQSPVPNLQLAGDWTDTGWPATMEGALRSGYRAAENLLRRRGIEAPLLQPDLPTAMLSRVLFGL
ncbi:MAG: FAD-dependent oxidoreductase, partial [Planctomycetaceae bacterium]